MTSALLALGFPGPFEMIVILAVLGVPLVFVLAVVWFARRTSGRGTGDFPPR